MAYTASIAIAVKGIQDLQALRQKIEAAAEGVNKFNNFAKEAFGGDFVRSLNNVKNALVSASNAFDDAALGTSRAVDAAKAYIAANREMNATLKERERLIRAVISAEGAEAMVRIGVRPGASQRLLPAAAPGSPAMSGGARSLITGPVERLGGARTQDEAATALRFAQALKEQVRPLSQIESLYAGISRAAAQTQRFKALPDTAMLNAAGRGIQQLENAQDRYNRELQESTQRLQEVDRLEASRERRAAKLRGIAAYYAPETPTGVPTNRGRGPVSPIRGGVDMPGSPAALEAAEKARNKMSENLMLGIGFPLLFGGGVGEVAGGLLGSFAGEGFGGQILGSAIGRIIQDFGKAAIDLAKTLESPASSFDQIKEKSLLSTKAQERYVETLIKNGEIAKANAVIYQDFNKRFGETSLTSLRVNSDKLARSMAELGVRMQLVVAGPLDKFIGGLNNVLAGLNVQEAAEKLSGKLQGPQKAQFEQERLRIAGLQFKGVFGGITQEQAVEQMLELLDKYEKFVPKKNVPLSVDDLKLQLEAGRALRDVYAENFKLQLEKGLAVRVLNGQILQDYVRTNEIQNEYLATNEKLAVVLKNVKDIEAAGGVAKGIVSAEEMNKLKNEILALENKKLDLKIQANKESLNQFEQQVRATAERAVRALDLQANAIQGQNTVYQSQLGLLKAGNDLYLQRLSMEEEVLNKTFEQSNNLAQQLAILDRLAEIVHIRFRLNVQNAKIERASALANLAQGNALLKIELQKQVVQYKRLVAVMKEAQAQGLLTRAHMEAVDAQYDAVVLAEQSLNYGIENAKIQAKIADSMYDQRIEAAGYARNLELAQLASRRSQLFARDGGSVRYGQGLGEVFRIGTTRKGSSFTAMATGGFVKQPTFALIGEGGQGEYVVPESKAAAFAMNYMLGARGAGAIDGNAAPPAINIQTGPVMQQGGQNYVTIQDMEAGLQAVADTILNNSRSYSARRFAGVS